MANKSMKPSAPVRREPTPEEKQEQALRAFVQERKMLIQGIAFNLAGNSSFLYGGETTPQQFAEYAVTAADEVLKKQYTRDEQAPEIEK